MRNLYRISVSIDGEPADDIYVAARSIAAALTAANHGRSEGFEVTSISSVATAENFIVVDHVDRSTARTASPPISNDNSKEGDEA